MKHQAKRIISQHIRPLQPIATGMHKTGKRIRGIRCVLFDIYGTLFISAAGDIGIAGGKTDSGERIDRLFKRFGIAKDFPATVQQLSQAVASAQRAQQEKGILFPEIEIDRIWAEVLGNSDSGFIRRFALEYELTVNPVYPMPGAKDLIRTCRSKKLRMGLISNAQFYTSYFFEWLLGGEPVNLGFDPALIFLSYRFGRAKPSPELFEAAAAVLGRMEIAPAEVLYMGNDMLKDILPAARVGFHTALFAGDRRSLRLRKEDPCCRNLAADLVLTELRQLFEFIT